jgi:hypothetical protein
MIFTIFFAIIENRGKIGLYDNVGIEKNTIMNNFLHLIAQILGRL